MIIYQDHREKHGQHNLVEQHLIKQGYTIKRVRLNVGDYMFPSGGVSVDLKADIEELASDLHRDKLALNKKYKKCYHDKIKLVVLIEQKVSTLNELMSWKSNHSKITGRYLVELMHNLKVSYGVRFVFCTPKETPTKLLELLKE